uniref:DUF1985 domain-containing protein n=1 Tax=Cannabis sativa TaxID=3483 RepID=A0A803Q0U0_CANSA
MEIISPTTADQDINMVMAVEDYHNHLDQPGCSTPTRPEFQIPVRYVPPPPPKKKRNPSVIGKKRVSPKNGYFHPPDLEAFFASAPRPAPLFHSLLLRKVVQPNDNEIWFNVASWMLRFSIEELALVSGLDCSGQCDKLRYKHEKNLLKEKIFAGFKEINKKEVENAFIGKRILNWSNDTAPSVKEFKNYIFIVSLSKNLDDMGKGKYAQIDDVGSQGSVDENSLSFKFVKFHRRLADIYAKQKAFSAKFFILKEDFKNMMHSLESVHKKIDMLLSRPPPKDSHDVEEYDNEEDAEIEEASQGDEDNVKDDGEDDGDNEEGVTEDVSQGEKMIIKQSYALVLYDPQSATSANLDKVLGRPYCRCGQCVAVENFVNVDEITPPIERRIPKLGLHLQSPYAQQLSSSSKPTVVTSKVKGLCALQQSVVDDVNDDDEKAFDALFKSGSLKRPTKNMNGHFLYFAPADNKLDSEFVVAHNPRHRTNPSSPTAPPPPPR